MNRSGILLLVILSGLFLRAESDQIIQLAVHSPEALTHMVSVEYLEFCNRLEINYQDNANKGLIGYGFTEFERQKILENPAGLEIAHNELDEGQMITVRHPDLYRPVYFALRDSLLISPYQLQSENWTVHEGMYIEYRISDEILYDPEQLVLLDKFCEYLMELLQVPAERKKLLQENKIVYYRCADADEIMDLTGYNCRGMGILAEDAVISIYPCHFHELCHLMMNFALEDVPLYTHPFLQEGFAVATGGRGGKNSDVLLDIAAFICKSGFMTPQELFDVNNFRANDASFTYPLSGLYNRFLIDKIGMEQYLRLYRAYSNSTGEFIKIKIANLLNDQWQQYLDQTDFSHIITIDPDEEFITCERDNGNEIADSQNYFRFSLQDDNIRFAVNKSIKFTDSGNYLIEVSENEINIRNLITQNLIAGYTAGLSLDPVFLKDESNRVIFYLPVKYLDYLKRGF